MADVDVLSTLPRDERAQGLVEAFKHGAILDEVYFRQLEENAVALLDADAPAACAAVQRSVELKAAVVAEDEFEEGYRQILNFGHTLGHALEAASDYELGHGRAVALGMLLEAEVGERLGITEAGTRQRLASALEGLVAVVPRSVDADVVVRYLRADKKARAGRPRVVLLRKLGEVDPGQGWSHEVPEQLLSEVLGSRS